MSAYRNVHNWVSYNFGKASKCEKCGRVRKIKGKKRTFSWANISGLYKRIRSDWRQLCYSCHKKFDYENGRWKPWNKGRKGKQKNHNFSGLNTGVPWNRGKKTGLVPRSAFKKGGIPWNKKSI